MKYEEKINWPNKNLRNKENFKIIASNCRIKDVV